jgi:hypothetical protein
MSPLSTPFGRPAPLGLLAVFKVISSFGLRSTAAGVCEMGGFGSGRPALEAVFDEVSNVGLVHSCLPAPALFLIRYSK